MLYVSYTDTISFYHILILMIAKKRNSTEYQYMASRRRSLAGISAPSQHDVLLMSLCLYALLILLLALALEYHRP